MTNLQKYKIKMLDAEIGEIRAAIREAVASGAASATLSSAGNSQGYTRISLRELNEQLQIKLRARRAVLGNGAAIRRTAPDFGGV